MITIMIYYIGVRLSEPSLLIAEKESSKRLHDSQRTSLGYSLGSTVGDDTASSGYFDNSADPRRRELGTGSSDSHKYVHEYGGVMVMVIFMFMFRAMAITPIVTTGALGSLGLLSSRLIHKCSILLMLSYVVLCCVVWSD